MTDDPDVLFPCVGICTADSETGRCTGCGAPLIEISPEPLMQNGKTTPEPAAPDAPGRD